MLHTVGFPTAADAVKDTDALQQHILQQLPLQWSQRTLTAPVGTLLSACQSSASKQPTVTLVAVKQTRAEAHSVAALYLYGGLQVSAASQQQYQHTYTSS